MSSENKRLATLQKVTEVKPIPNNYSIEKIKVLGWEIIVHRGDFKVGDLGIFFEVESFLPELPRYDFLRRTSYKRNSLVGGGFLIRTKYINGNFSQGLFMPIKDFPEIDFTDMEIGTDLTRRLNVKWYKEPEDHRDFGNGIKIFHYKIPKAYEPRLQSAEYLNEYLKGKPFYITEQIDGINILIVKEHKVIRVFANDMEIRDNDKSSVWKMLHQKGIVNALKYSEDVFIYGELFGPGIKKNRLKAKELDFRFFDLGDPNTGKFYSFDEWHKILLKTRLSEILEPVKILEIGTDYQHTPDELKKLSVGNYDNNGGKREGIIIRPRQEMEINGERVSFKVLNNYFLLR